jgi:methionine synthase II (cobalamin-independent)
MTITRDILIEDLVRELPASVRYLREKGIRCLQCGEPVWGTLAEAARGKGFADADIDRFVGELNRLGGGRE